MPIKLSREKYNPDSLFEDARFILETTTNEEKLAWLKHPCTAALVKRLEGDMCTIVSVWMAGGYADEESVEATAQRQAAARAKAQAIDDVVEQIALIAEPTEG